ncbi:hypothetical protein [uncultured Alistipes sp.]|uniref:hypothetical protein n=1 Tax=uncultured Alistipes sp. TaxID=538949 RepID=UPI0025EA7C04|nr:hypothetical protein [uncultured Alistipes sp.]
MKKAAASDCKRLFHFDTQSRSDFASSKAPRGGRRDKTSAAKLNLGFSPTNQKVAFVRLFFVPFDKGKSGLKQRFRPAMLHIKFRRAALFAQHANRSKSKQ